MSDTFNAVLPAEWAPQSGIQLTWPHAGTDWAHMLTEVQACFAASILAQQRKNFAAVNIQTHLIIGQHRAKALGHIANADGCGSLFQPAHSFMIANRK